MFSTEPTGEDIAAQGRHHQQQQHFFYSDRRFEFELSELEVSRFDCIGSLLHYFLPALIDHLSKTFPFLSLFFGRIWKILLFCIL